MSINQLIMNALSGLNVPVSFQTYSGTVDPYITFFCYLETGELYYDDIQKGTAYYVQVDVWSKGNYSSIVEQVKSAMQNAGFSFLSAYDLYEDDTKIYHKVLRFYYFKEVE
ncbi:tail completion protein gp17 [Caldanaerobius polysaccharolyticus]|uniref:tail completion protein gp17 n=1 Tax=Caldanaerobius polysaccharolyticus TaxID=44256 RepID=UPI0004797F0B